MMRRHEERRIHVVAVPVRTAQAFGQLVRHTFGHLPGVDEDQRRAVLARVRDAVQDVGELQATGHRFELAVGQFDRHVQLTGMAAVDDHRGRTLVLHTREQTGHHVEWTLRGREPDALQMPAALGDQTVQSFETQRQVAAALSRAKVCTSSTMTVRTPRNNARDEGAVRRR